MWRSTLVALIGVSLLLPATWVDADQVDERIEQLNELLKEMPTVVAERRADTAIVTGWTRSKDEEKLLGKILKMVGDVEDFTGPDLDDPSRMVEIDVALVVVLNTDSKSYGYDFLNQIFLNFDYFTSHHPLEAGFGINKPGTGSAGTSYSSSSFGGGGTQSGTFLQARVNYEVSIANATDDRVAIIARPHLTTLNGEKAEFNAGGEIVFKVSGVSSGRIQPYPYGIQLQVTPTVLRTPGPNGETQVLLDVDAARSTILGLQTVNANPENDDVSFDKVQVKSKALLAMNETLILSGLYQREHRTAHAGVPFLRKIPIIKYFFSNRSEVEEVLSTVIFITPREPGILNERNLENLNKFIERRNEYVQARELGGTAIEDFQAKYSDWYKPQSNRYASHFFLVGESSIYSELRGEDLRTEEIRRDIMSIHRAD